MGYKLGLSADFTMLQPSGAKSHPLKIWVKWFISQRAGNGVSCNGLKITPQITLHTLKKLQCGIRAHGPCRTLVIVDNTMLAAMLAAAMAAGPTVEVHTHLDNYTQTDVWPSLIAIENFTAHTADTCGLKG